MKWKKATITEFNLSIKQETWWLTKISYIIFIAVITGSSCQPKTESTDAGGGHISGVVTGPNGPEAGVWVIAETHDLPTRYAKIVVTDDEGRYVMPELPDANYSVWVRGYGLVDSPKKEA